MTRRLAGAALLACLGFFACSSKDKPVEPPPPAGRDTLNVSLPGFPPPNVPLDNPVTRQGAELGERLFREKLLSADGTQACASCHQPGRGFSDSLRFSVGIAADGFPHGNRNAPALINLAFGKTMFWDGRASNLEAQVNGPVTNPIEMHENWDRVVTKLSQAPLYPSLFEAAFDTREITADRVAKAIAQYERTLTTNNSKFDRFLRGEALLDSTELRGYVLFQTDPTPTSNGADCWHCHSQPLFTDHDYHSVGLDAAPADRGRAAVTNDPNDEGEYKTPTLRNLVFTPPYMHDGRFRTIDEVIDHYNAGVVETANRSPFAHLAANGGLRLTAGEKHALKRFLLTLTDSTFVEP